MGELYTRFKNLKKQSKRDFFMDRLGLVKFEYKNKKYEVYYTKRRANRYSIIHCVNNTVEWEQFPILPRISGRLNGKREPIISLGARWDCVRIFVISGKPNMITGLDEGNFRSVHRFDENYVNIMSEARFKEL